MKKTGSSMGGSIEYTNSVRPIPCNCFVCYHSHITAGVLHCSYYDIIKPAKKTCARFYAVKGKNLAPRKKKKKRTKKRPDNRK